MLLRIIGGALIVVVSFFVSLKAMDVVWPRQSGQLSPQLAQMPPLPPVSRTSIIIAPTAIALTAVREAMEQATPRNLSGKQDNTLGGVLKKADIGWTAARGPLALSGRPEGLTLSTQIHGALRATGQIATQAGNLTGTIAGLVNESVGRELGNVTGRVLDQRADMRGTISVTSRPTLLPEWRIEPNLSAQVNMGNTTISLGGIRIAVKEFKPMLDRAIGDQMNTLQAQLRGNPFLEHAARREWEKMCRAIPLGNAAAGMPALFLELRPTRAFAAQPRIDANTVTITVGVQAETRIVPSAGKPSCPFPNKLEIVQQLEQGHMTIGVPIDMPFTELNKVLEAQLKGKTFPQDGDGAAEVTVLGASLAASGERLLISLRVKAREKKSWFGFGAEATVHVWGKPVLDREQQMLRLSELSLAVDSDGAFGLLGAAAQAAVPYLEEALIRYAVIDLRPFTASARSSIEAAIRDFRKEQGDVQVLATVNDLRLDSIAFDSKMLRVIAEADGAVNVAIARLPR